MRVNSQNVRSITLLLSLVFMLILLNSCAIKEIFVEKFNSPEGVWEYPGGAVKPMSMFFQSDGRLVFVGGFEKFNPATWNYNNKTKILSIKISNYDKSVTDCSDDYEREYTCLTYNSKTDAFECKWTPKTKSLGFLGWNFLRK